MGPAQGRPDLAEAPGGDPLVAEIAAYAAAPLRLDAEGRAAARLSLLDSLGVVCPGDRHPDGRPLLGALSA